MRVVLDTNTIVSAIGWDGPLRRVLLALRDDPHTLVTSPELLDELTKVLSYPKLRQIAVHPLLPVVLEWLHRGDYLVIPRERTRVIRRDPADNLVLDTAVAGRVDVIVSGDRDLLVLKHFQGIPILTARVFVTRHL